MSFPSARLGAAFRLAMPEHVACQRFSFGLKRGKRHFLNNARRSLRVAAGARRRGTTRGVARCHAQQVACSQPKRRHRSGARAERPLRTGQAKSAPPDSTQSRATAVESVILARRLQHAPP